MLELIAKTMARNWWVLLIRGLAAMAFGLLGCGWPGLTLVSLILLWGIYAFVDGITALVGGMADKFWASLLIGLAGICAGLYAFFYPGLTALILLYCIAAWVIVRGVFEIVVAIRLRKVITGEWMLILAGLLSIALGIMLFLNPGAGALAAVYLICAYAFLFGLILVILSFRVKKLA